MDNQNSQNAQDGNQGGVSLDNVIDVQNVNLDNGLGGLDPITPPATPPSGNEPPTPPVTPDPNTPSGEVDEVLSLLTGDISSLSADDAAFRSNLLTTFGGTSTDVNGNLLNAKGQIVLSYQDLNKYVDTGEMNKDSNGNVINALGEVITTSNQLTNNPLDTTVEAIAEEYGFQFLDEEGKPKVYGNDDNGRKQFAEDIISNTSVVAVSSFLDSEPELKDIFYYLKNGGNIKDYADREVNYADIDINDLSKEQKIAYVRQSFERQGLKNGSSMLKLIENAGDDQITQSTAEALLTLSELTESQKEADKAAYEAQLEKDNKKVIDYWNNVESVIKQGKLKDLTIADDKRADFFKYIATPINAKGDTQERLDADKEDVEFNLLVSYLRFNKYDLSKLVNDRAGLSRLDKFKGRFNNPNPRIENTDQRANENSNQSGANHTPSIEDLLG